MILSVDGHPVVGPTISPATSPLTSPARRCTLEVLRDGKHEQVDVTLGKRPQG